MLPDEVQAQRKHFCMCVSSVMQNIRCFSATIMQKHIRLQSKARQKIIISKIQNQYSES